MSETYGRPAGYFPDDFPERTTGAGQTLSHLPKIVGLEMLGAKLATESLNSRESEITGIDNPNESETELQFTAFESNSQRDAAVVAIYEEYKFHPAAQYKPPHPKSAESVNDNLDLYLQEVRQYNLLTAASERELFGRIEKGLKLYQQLGGFGEVSQAQEDVFTSFVAAYDEIYESNLRLVIREAKKRIRFNLVPLSDMIQDGNIGLLTAVRRFDVTKTFKFSTYAVNWIRQSIEKGVADSARTIRMPGHQHEQWVKIKRISGRLESGLNRPPTNAEVAEENGVTERQVDFLARMGARVISLNRTVGGDQDAELGDLIPDKAGIDQEIDAISDREELTKIFAASELNSLSLTVICLRYGVYVKQLANMMVPTQRGTRSYQEIMKSAKSDEIATLQSVADILGVTRERVRQIEQKSIFKMRNTTLKSPRQ